MIYRIHVFWWNFLSRLVYAPTLSIHHTSLIILGCIAQIAEEDDGIKQKDHIRTDSIL